MQKFNFTKFSNAVVLTAVCVCSMFFLSSCTESKNASDANIVVPTNGQLQDREISTESGMSFRVLSRALIGKSKTSSRPAESDEPVSPTDAALTLGYPLGLIGEQNLFGGVITEVSDTQDENLGNFKLSGIDPIHVVSQLSKDHSFLYLKGCKESCTQTSKYEVLFEIPVLSVDEQYAYLDLTAFGSGLDISKISGEKLVSDKTEVLRFEYSVSTLVFDVKNDYSNQEKKFSLTTRWYLKLTSGFTPGFTTRIPTPEVGYFQTSRNSTSLLTRWALKNDGSEALAHYFIKNVPAEYQKAFADAFEDWNQKLEPVLGKKVFSYEFLDSSDARFKTLVAGDVRYNILEWDLINKADYGGLGPSLANQMTGEIFNANVLIQGPTILELYKKWFKISTWAQKLESSGKVAEAAALRAAHASEMSDYRMNLNNRRSDRSKLQIQDHELNLPASDPRLEDPALDGADFIDIPTGYTFETYMYGYFRDMVAHELGHNLGLRHNFKGSLFDDGSGQVGSATISVMEYLDRSHRHLSRVGDYDKMALEYGYLGKKPTHSDWYCTDEDQVDSVNFEKDAECSSNDSTNDPFGNFIAKIQKAKDFLILPGSELASPWSMHLIYEQILPAVSELANYSVSSYKNAAHWQRFKNSTRNIEASKTPDYIIRTLAELVCDKDLESKLKNKTAEGRSVALKNMEEFVQFFQGLTSDYVHPENNFTKDNFSCFQ